MTNGTDSVSATSLLHPHKVTLQTMIMLATTVLLMLMKFALI